MKLAKELSDTVVYCKSVHFEGFDDPNHPRAFYEMSSFSESKALKLAQESGTCVLPSSVPVPQRGTAAGGKGIPKTWVVISLVMHVTVSLRNSGKQLNILEAVTKKGIFAGGSHSARLARQRGGHSSSRKS